VNVSHKIFLKLIEPCEAEIAIARHPFRESVRQQQQQAEQDMNVQIYLDRPQQQFTNLDVITGSVRLHVPTSSNVSNVLVKLEGESRTRLVAPRDELGRERPRPVLEVHKVRTHKSPSFRGMVTSRGGNDHKSLWLAI